MNDEKYIRAVKELREIWRQIFAYLTPASGHMANYFYVTSDLHGAHNWCERWMHWCALVEKILDLPRQCDAKTSSARCYFKYAEAPRPELNLAVISDRFNFLCVLGP